MIFKLCLSHLVDFSVAVVGDIRTSQGDLAQNVILPAKADADVIVRALVPQSTRDFHVKATVIEAFGDFQKHRCDRALESASDGKGHMCRMDGLDVTINDIHASCPVCLAAKQRHVRTAGFEVAEQLVAQEQRAGLLPEYPPRTGVLREDAQEAGRAGFGWTWVTFELSGDVAFPQILRAGPEPIFQTDTGRKAEARSSLAQALAGFLKARVRQMLPRDIEQACQLAKRQELGTLCIGCVTHPNGRIVADLRIAVAHSDPVERHAVAIRDIGHSLESIPSDGGNDITWHPYVAIAHPKHWAA
ncbi:MAG: hypothetical protein Q8R81_12000 [Novosphingobium sp.]|uniref:hypothetical protein n=1 Tax=Novosphingobium sp. TaxID=1874826 RepID=UPI0027372924|nr:hypothetical protein [Novosphingobium sp.]MDP3551103.1 hypothetical protein [Novosphingobium sp.]